MLLDPFYVIEYPDWVQIVAIDTDDKLVLVEQYRHGLGISSIELPTGGIEVDDEDPSPQRDASLRRRPGSGQMNGSSLPHWRQIQQIRPTVAM